MFLLSSVLTCSLCNFFSRRMPCGKNILHSSSAIVHSKLTVFLHRLPQCPFEFLARRIQETPKTIQVIANTLGCLPEFDCKTTLLKILETSDTGLGGIDLEASYPRTSSHSLWGFYVSCQERTAINSWCKATLSQLGRMYVYVIIITIKINNKDKSHEFEERELHGRNCGGERGVEMI